METNTNCCWSRKNWNITSRSSDLSDKTVLMVKIITKIYTSEIKAEKKWQFYYGKILDNILTWSELQKNQMSKPNILILS